MAKLTGMPALLVLALLVALTGARPQSHRDVKLITKPLPGQEYVMIQRSAFTHKSDGEFMTAHSIPRALPVDHPEDLIVKTSKSKIKRESDSLDEEVPALAPKLAEAKSEVAEHPGKGGKVEVRTEFSVATSKRKGGKETKERAIAFSPKETSPAPVPSPTLDVNVENKGNSGKLEGTLTGADEKKVMIKKLSAADHATKVASKEELTLKEVEVQPSSELGVNSPQVDREEGAITVPLQKKQAVSAPQEVSTPTPLPNHTSQSPSQGFDILPVNILPKTAEKTNDKDKDFDFVDTPLADKVLVPAGSNQQSRIEVKKGPNGQDYEYEYVYYYYDDDENDAAGGAGAKKTAVVKGSTTSTTTATPTTSSRLYLPKKEAEAATRARTRGQSAAVAPEAKTKYTAIERVTTAAPETSNEIIPVRGAASRTRGRTLTTEEPTVAEERLPVNTRFPPRSRSNHNSNSVASTTPVPQDTPTTRVRGSSGANSVRRPSLELVDSSSFKTQSSDASRDQDPRPEFPKTLPAANEEEVVKPRGRGRGQTSTTPAPASDEEDVDIPSESHSRGQLSRRPDAAIRSKGQVTEDEEDDDISSLPASVTDVPEDVLSLTTITDVDMGLTDAAMDKAALELYAVLSQARAESNSIDEELSDDELTTELEDVSTTLEPTTEAPTTTTTTTTPAPTTTTTTTETPLAAGRGRYRQRGNVGTSAPRNRFRAGSSDAASTSTTETSAETSTKARARFGSNRVTSGGRRGFSKSTSPRPEEEAASESEAPKTDAAPPTHHRPAGGLPRNRFGSARIPKVTTPTSLASSSADETHAATLSSAAPAKPVFADRFNLRRRGGGIKLHSTPAPVSEETKAESSGEETNESAAEPSTTAASLLRVTARNRLSVGSGPRPLRPGARVNIASRGRLGAAATSTTVAPSTEAEDAGSEQTSSASQEETQPEEAQEAVTTPAPDALTRLRNRPRLRVSAVKPTSAPTAAPIRRPLIARRKLGHPVEVKESADAEVQDSSSVSDDAPPSSEETSETSGDEVSSPATTEPEQPQGLASLVSGRRRGNALRRPRTLLPGGKAHNPAS